VGWWAPVGWWPPVGWGGVDADGVVEPTGWWPMREDGTPVGGWHLGCWWVGGAGAPRFYTWRCPLLAPATGSPGALSTHKVVLPVGWAPRVTREGARGRVAGRPTGARDRVGAVRPAGTLGLGEGALW